MERSWMMSVVRTREFPPGDAGVREFLERHGAAVVARRGALLDATTRPAVVALASDASLAGVATYDVVGQECELLTLHAAGMRSGAGTVLVAAVREIAVRLGCHTLWVLTTNDNVDGLRFYQRRGFRLSVVRPGAVDESRRTLKPQIPMTGFYGIPLRDEIELVMPLAAQPAGQAERAERAEPPGAAPASTPRTS